MAGDIIVFRVQRNPAEKYRLQWKNHMYQAGATGGTTLAAKEWQVLNTPWPGLNTLKGKGKGKDNKKRSTFKPKEKDWLILDARTKKTQVHFVANSMLGETGTLYLRVKQQWVCILVRFYVPTLKVGHKPAHLGWVEGDDGDLLLTSRSATNPEEALGMIRGVIPVAYKYISGAEADDAEEVNDLWQVRSKGTPLYVKVDAKQADLEDKVQDALKIIVQDAKKGKFDGKNEFVTTLNELFGEGAAPSAVAGGSAIEATNNLIASWSSSKDLISPLTQGGHESIGIGAKLVMDLYRLHKLNHDDNADPKERKMIYHDIATSVAKGAPSVTAVVDTIGKIANAGQQIAGIATTANTIMPLVGAAVGFEEAGRNFRKSDRAFQRLVSIKTSAGWVSDDSDDEIAMDSELGLLTQYAIGKLARKSNRLGAVGMAGVFGSTGGAVIGMAALAGAANAWNPVGWVLLSVAAVGGMGIAGWTIYRHYSKGKRHNRRRDKGRPATPKRYAERLIDVYCTGKQGEHKHYEVAEQMLLSFKIPVKDGELDGITRPKAIKRIKRHFTK